jgi:integrase
MAITATDFTKTKHTGIKLHKDGITFLFDIRVDGKRYRKVWESNPIPTKADKLKIAYTKMEEFRKEVEHKNTITADVNATVLDYWIKLKAVKNWKPYMVKEYNHYYKRNLDKLSNIKVKDLKPAHFTELNTTLTHLSTRSRLKAYEILQPLIALAIEDEIIIKSPIKKSHIAKRKSLEEKKIIINAADKYKLVHKAIHDTYADKPVYRAAFLFCFHGRRVSESLQLQWQDIDFIGCTYTVRGATSKVNTDMTFTLPSDVKEALLEFADVSGDIFPFKSIDRQYHKIREATGINEFTAHWMRNLSVSALASMGVSATHLSSLLGHQDGGTIRKYLSLQREASTAVTNEASQRLLS